MNEGDGWSGRAEAEAEWRGVRSRKREEQKSGEERSGAEGADAVGVCSHTHRRQSTRAVSRHAQSVRERGILCTAASRMTLTEWADTVTSAAGRDADARWRASTTTTWTGRGRTIAPRRAQPCRSCCCHRHDDGLLADSATRQESGLVSLPLSATASRRLDSIQLDWLDESLLSLLSIHSVGSKQRQRRMISQTTGPCTQSRQSPCTLSQINVISIDTV